MGRSFNILQRLAWMHGYTTSGLMDWTNAQILCDGNSLTEGAVGSTYPGYLQALSPWSSNGSTVRNFGVGGQTTPQMISDAATQIDPLFIQGVPNIVIAWEIGNDINFNGNEVTAYNNFVSYCQSRKAAGFMVAVLNVTYRQWGGGPTTDYGDTWAQFNAKVDTVNALLAANWQDYADLHVDLISDARLADPTDTTYYSDGIHHNPAGKQVIADLVSAALLTM